MIKICFVSSFGFSSDVLTKSYSKQLPKDGIEGLTTVLNPNEADYVIAMQGLDRSFNYDLKKCLVFQREPLAVQRFNPVPGAVNLSHNDHFNLVTWHLKESYDELKNFNREKTKLVSCVISGKYTTKMQKKRLDFVKAFSKKYPGIVDIYGVGHPDGAFGGDDYKGPIDNKLDAIADYKYSIAIENGEFNNYFTEKIADVLLCRTKPLYYGCPNITEFFDKDAIQMIDVNDVDSLYHFLKNNESLDRDLLDEQANLVLDKYNLWFGIKNLINNLEKNK